MTDHKAANSSEAMEEFKKEFGPRPKDIEGAFPQQSSYWDAGFQGFLAGRQSSAPQEAVGADARADFIKEFGECPADIEGVFPQQRTYWEAGLVGFLAGRESAAGVAQIPYMWMSAPFFNCGISDACRKKLIANGHAEVEQIYSLPLYAAPLWRSR